MKEERYVTYEAFGAVGDGIHDDFEAIIQAHEYANEQGLPVRAKDDATYYISGKAITAVVKTPTNFGKAHFIIDDRNVSNRATHIFHVKSDFDYYPIQIDRLEQGQRRIDIPHEGNLFVKVKNENKRVYIRYGANANDGTPQKDYFTVDKNGNIGTLMAWQFDEVTEALAKSTDDPPISIEGGTFTRIANRTTFEERGYYRRGIRCNRSHVHFKNITHLIKGEPEPEEHYSSPYAGFLAIDECFDVRIENVLFTPHRTYHFFMENGVRNAIGTYDLHCAGAIALQLIRIGQTVDIMDNRYWGLMGTDFCKDMLLDGCRISRFDAHQGVHNVTMRDCEFGHVKMEVIGFGELLIERCKLHGNYFMLLRGDYGSFFKGNMTIRDSFWEAIPTNGRATFFNAHNGGTHNFGYICEMPRNVCLENVFIDDTAIDHESDVFALFNRYDAYFSKEKPFPYVATKHITLKNVQTKSGKPIQVFQDETLFEETTVTAKDSSI